MAAPRKAWRRPCLPGPRSIGGRPSHEPSRGSRTSSCARCLGAAAAAAAAGQHQEPWRARQVSRARRGRLHAWMSGSQTTLTSSWPGYRDRRPARTRAVSASHTWRPPASPARAEPLTAASEPLRTSARGLASSIRMPLVADVTCYFLGRTFVPSQNCYVCSGARISSRACVALFVTVSQERLENLIWWCLK